MRMTVLLLIGCTAAAHAEQRAIDQQKSAVAIHVYKAGILSAFGHDHEVSAPVASGSVDSVARQVEVRIEASALTVRDPKASEKDRAEIRKTMLGPDVLDVAHYPEISFRSTSAEPSGDRSWKVQGLLTLHGQTKPIAVEVAEQGGRYVGHALLQQTDFGIKPVRAGGGTVRVKDELRIEFDIQLTH